MIHTVIFDIGNVLTGFNWQAYFDSFGYNDETKRRIVAATVQNPAWNELDRGVMTDEEVFAEFVKSDPGIEKELRESLTDIANILTRCDYAIPWIKELRAKGYQVLLLSNFSRKAFVDCAHALDFLPYADGGILSYAEHCIKPEPEIYQKLIAKYHLNPEECVFLDDLQRNLDGAAAFGIHTILFRSYEQAVEDLKKLGVH